MAECNNESIIIKKNSHNGINIIDDDDDDDLEQNDELNHLLLLSNGLTIEQTIDDEQHRHVQFNQKLPSNYNTTFISTNISTNTTSTSGTNTNSSTSTSTDSSSLELSEARPPDGGWGWVVVAASFIVNLIADGITFSFGVIFVEFLKYFGQNRGTTAWIGSLFMAMPLLSGPIASFLTDRYGCRKVTIFGAILASIGFVISSQADSMTVLCITFGILAGFGLSLCYVASVVIVAYYFDKKRSFATGLAVCGSGIGTFIFAPFIQMLLQEYGWRGTTLILAGLFLNLVVCGALMRDLPWTSQKQKIMAEERKRKRRERKMKHKNSSAEDTFTNSTVTALQMALENGDLNAAIIDGAVDNNHERLSSSLVNLPTYVRNGEKIPAEVLELLTQHRHVYDVLMTNYPNLLKSSRSVSDSERLHEKNNVLLTKHRHNRSVEVTAPPSTSTAKLNHKPIGGVATTSFLKDLRVHRLSVTYRGAMLNINRYRLRASSCPDIYRNSMTTIAKEKHTTFVSGLWDLWYLLVDMFDFSHFSDPKFLLFAISNFLLYTWYDVPYVYLTDNATTLGFSENDASILISIIGIVNMFGEVLLGWVGDRSWADASLIYAICMALCGAVTALIPIVTDYRTLCVVSGAFGFFIAANYALTSIILVELITLDRFTNAYGLLLLVQGVANLIGPPLGGWLCDLTMTYDLSFFLAGLFIALSGVLLVILPLVNRYKKLMQLKKNESLLDGITSIFMTGKVVVEKAGDDVRHI